jgi:S1-C subfamily serine protease
MSHINNPLVAVSEDLADAVARVANAVVAVHADHRYPSSGVIWRDGLVVTAAHTIRREEEIEVTLADGNRAQAELVGLDAGTDLALLRVDAAKTPAIERSDASALRVGQLAIAAARLGKHGVSATLGMIGGLGGAWRSWRGGQVERLIRVAITLYPGFSGGALLDAHSRVIGVSTAGLARSGAIALPHVTVDRVANELVAKGYVARPYLGVALQSVRLPESLQKKLALDRGTGVIVLSIEADGPAERAGVLVGDVFLSIDGQPVSDTRDVQLALRAEHIGRPVPATIVRGGALIVLQIALGERPRRSR